MIGPHDPLNVMATTDAQAIAAEVRRYGSPLAAHAERIVALGHRYRVDPAFFLGVTKIDNLYGMSQPYGVRERVWDPATGMGTYNWARIPDGGWGGRPVSGRRDGQYPNIEIGIAAFFRLVAGEYYPRGQVTPFAIWWGIGGSEDRDGEHAYSPASENVSFSLDAVVDVMNAIETAWTLFPFPVEVARGL